MAKAPRDRPQSDRLSTPGDFAATNPPAYPSADHSFTLQAVMEMHQTIGSLKTAVEALTTTVNSHGGKIDKMSHRLYAAGAVIIVLLAIGGALAGVAGYVVNKVTDRVLDKYEFTAKPPAAAKQP